MKFFAKMSSCLVGREACALSEYWARTIKCLGAEYRGKLETHDCQSPDEPFGGNNSAFP
ncbi:MAG: hypothetical protein LBR94_02975 [Desulfovibrio sp.]|jgi:hypothetical protein|nr:hypothetical protein [Desulfovibrio sp.]